MLEFFLRALLGGLVIGLVPIVVRRFGDTPGAILTLVPAITLVSLTVLWLDVGSDATAKVATRALAAVPTVAVFLGVFALLAARGLSLWATAGASLAAWLAAAVLVALLLR